MDRLDELKGKYKAALDAIQQQGVQLSHVHVQDNKLFVQGAAPTEDAKNQVWNKVKEIDSSYKDLTLDLTVDLSLPAPKAQAAAASADTTTGARTYTVQPGDSLSKIAKQYYGNANDYNKIFEANRDKLENPDKVRAGQELVIPV